ncbi:hypothetical protein JTB14_012264 [Gonioctena quinquepunctata]|nr:hypothetical protein JTB14_012264 [Gonioctena quinquepunctata]
MNNMNNIGLGSNVRTFVAPNPRSLPYAGTQQNENLFLPYIQVSHSQGAHSYFGKNYLGSLHMSNPHGGTVPPVMENISVNNKLCSAKDLESYESPPTYNNEGSLHPLDFFNYIETFVDVYNLDINKFSLMVRDYGKIFATPVHPGAADSCNCATFPSKHFSSVGGYKFSPNSVRSTQTG